MISNLKTHHGLNKIENSLMVKIVDTCYNTDIRYIHSKEIALLEESS